MNWYVEVLKKYAVFNGRARRREYWNFALLNIIISLVLSVTGMDTIEIIYMIAVLIPGIAVAVRRLHDTGRSGWWILIALIPFIGAIVLIVFLVQDSKPGQNQYGVNPKETAII